MWKKKVTPLKCITISLPKLMQVMSNPSNNKSHHFLHLCCSTSQTYFKYRTIYTLYSKNHVWWQLCIHKLPHPENDSTQRMSWQYPWQNIKKNNKPGPDLGGDKKTTMSTRWTVARAVAAVASWKMSMQENLEAKSAGNASRYWPSCFLFHQWRVRFHCTIPTKYTDWKIYHLGVRPPRVEHYMDVYKNKIKLWSAQTTDFKFTATNK